MINNQELKKVANVLRALSIDQVETAKSGHPGLPLGCADILAVLYSQFLTYDPDDANWIFRDRFVLSAGHGSALLYATLALFTNNVSVEELRTFRQAGSRLAGHPESHLLPGVEATTGPLGQGVGNAVGLALAAKMLKARQPQAREFRVFCLCSDGDLMEGISYEACSLAGFLGLDNLILMYDDNKVSLAGPTSVCFNENIRARFEAQGWVVFEADGLDISEVQTVLGQAISSDQKRPRLIIFRTQIGYASPKANSHEVHGAPLGKEDSVTTKQNLGVPLESFHVPEDVKITLENIKKTRKSLSQEEKQRSSWDSVEKKYPLEDFIQFGREAFGGGNSLKEATRNTGEKFLKFAAQRNPCVVGGSADLEPSTKAYLKGEKDVGPEDFSGRNIRFGVREHAMASICNGLALSGFFKPFCSTFLCFLDYLKPSLRLSALSGLPVLYVLTHDSVLLGEDGPTHQPVEHLSHLRSIPNFVTFRPSNPDETAFAYWWWLNSEHTPCAVILSRQNFQQVRANTLRTEDLIKGFSIVLESENPSITVLASGSEVAMAAEAITMSGRSDVELVSVNSFELLIESLKGDSGLRDRVFRGSTVILCELSSVPSTAHLTSMMGGASKAWIFYTLSSFGLSGRDQDVAQSLGFSASHFSEFLKKI